MPPSRAHHLHSRRSFLLGSTALTASAFATSPLATSTQGAPIAARRKALHLVLAPSNLGLRPEENGAEPGTWRAPEVLIAAGLETHLGAERVVKLQRPTYDTNAQSGTRIRNGNTLRHFSLGLAEAVRTVFQADGFPLVIGGDCSVLLGSLYGARLAGARGLIHIDGHSDFFHPGNYDARQRLGSAAGMDLALATGRGESLLTHWPHIDGPLARDEDVIQLGERDALTAEFRASYGDIESTAIQRYTVQDVLKAGIEDTAQSVIERFQARNATRVWLHVDLDVLDQSVMSAVDSPGSPGLTFAQLGLLIARLQRSGRITGATVTIYDPALDPQIRYATPIVRMLGEAFARS